VNLAQSRNRLTEWEASVENPIGAPNPDPNSWNYDATYKPFALFDQATGQWLPWYNGRCEHLERIAITTPRAILEGLWNRLDRRRCCDSKRGERCWGGGVSNLLCR
jgi:hypothetical protein